MQKKIYIFKSYYFDRIDSTTYKITSIIVGSTQVHEGKFLSKIESIEFSEKQNIHPKIHFFYHNCCDVMMCKSIISIILLSGVEVCVKILYFRFFRLN